MAKKCPIGIFDSGVGGLSIAHGIRSELPSEDILYVADLGYSPYGSKAKEIIEDRSEYMVDYLCKQGCKVVVVACNTATVNSIAMLREKFDIPIVGVEPGIKPAAMQSSTGVIAVLATEQTIKSVSFQELKNRFSELVKIETRACPGLVELVESGNIHSKKSISVVSDYVVPLLSKGADRIVLGCTHFSFLAPVMEPILKDKARLVDTAKPVALEVKNQLTNHDLLRPCGVGEIQFCSTEMSANTSRKIGHLWGDKVDVLGI